MSRRALGATLLAAGLLTSGLVPLLGSAGAAACPSWTDKAGDASTFQAGLPGTATDNLDIVAVSVGSTATDLVATVTLKKLAATASDAGDEFNVQFTVAGQTLLMFADRSTVPLSSGAGVLNVNDNAPPIGTATATYDVAKSVVTITAKIAQVDAAAATATTGKPATKMSAATIDQAGQFTLLPYDSALAATDATFTVGTACGSGGGGDPTPTPTPTTPPPTTPPPATGDCADFSDPKGDAPPVAAAPQASANDPDLDITGYTLQTTADKFVSYIKVDKLATRPAAFLGHTFYSEFTFNKHAFSIFAAAYDPAAIAQARNTASASVSNLLPTAQFRVDSTYKNDVVVDAVFDTAKSMVKLTVPRAALDKYAAVPFADGGTLTLVKARSTADSVAVNPNGGDTTGPADATLVIGSNKCFPPPPAKLANAGATTVQYSDAASVAAKLTNEAGAALAGKAVKFTVGSVTVTATSGSDGVARASVDPGAVAGTYPLVASFAGDSVAGKASVTTPLVVTVEGTRLALSFAKNGSKRTATARLADDDGQPLAGQVVTFLVNGKKAGTATTNASGVATFAAKAGQTVVADFAAVTGKYAAAKATGKA
jgi:hypothetical protein